MNRSLSRIAQSLCLAAPLLLAAPAWSLTGVQVGASGKTYASAGIVCAMNPVSGMTPQVAAGLYNPKKGATATVALNGAAVATVTFASPDATIWLTNGIDVVDVALSRRVGDSYTFDATPASPGQINVCLPDTSANTISADVEYAASLKSYATLTPGCAFNSLTGRAQPFVNLFDNGSYLLNVSVNNVPLTQLNGISRRSVPVFLGPGHNVISATNGSLSTDFYVRDGGTGSCAL